MIKKRKFTQRQLKLLSGAKLKKSKKGKMEWRWECPRCGYWHLGHCPICP